MREIRPYGSEGGAALRGRPYPYVRPTAHGTCGVEVPTEAKASSLVSEPYCAVVRPGGKLGEENWWPVGERT
jgi:hypothetical protein